MHHFEISPRFFKVAQLVVPLLGPPEWPINIEYKNILFYKVPSTTLKPG